MLILEFTVRVKKVGIVGVSLLSRQQVVAFLKGAKLAGSQLT